MSYPEIPQYVEAPKKVKVDAKEYQRNYNKVRKVKYGIDVICECGKTYTKWNESKHFKTVNHINVMKIKNLEKQLNENNLKD